MTILLALILPATLAAEGPPSRPIVLPATRDVWFSEVGKEADGNNGAAPKLKLKSYQELSILDFDTKALKGRAIRRATLRLRSTGEPRLKRVTVGGIASDWVEGTGTNYEAQPKSSTFNHRRYPYEAWTPDGGDLCSVLFGPRGALWATADASPPDKDGWQEIPVDPRVVAARVAGLSFGFVAFDDTGSEWKRDGDKVELIHMPNRFAYSRDQNRASTPTLVVEPGDEDRQPPGPPTGLRARSRRASSGRGPDLVGDAPADRGASGTIGFVVSVAGVPARPDQVPLAGRVGGELTMKLALPRGDRDAEVSISGVDGAGNVGPAAKAVIRRSARTPRALPPARREKPAAVFAPLPRLGGAEVAVIDELDKVQPVTGEMIPPHPDAYLRGNPLWASARGVISLEATKNEFVAFQVLIRGSAPATTTQVEFAPSAKAATSIGRYRSVASAKGPMPDPIVPVTGPLDLPAAGEEMSSLHVEVYIPRDAKAGTHRGLLTLKSEDQRLVLPIELTVWDATLPDRLSFLPEMNCYGLPDNDLDFYRLANAHRVFLNRVPYSHNGRVHDGFAPKWDGKKLDWTAWDKRFAPLFDGSAFAGLPRAGVPIEAFYLPLFENWPTPIDPNFNGDSWADRALSGSYRRDFVEVSRQFAEHLRSKGWDDTFFECFFNGKIDFKRNGWSRATSPWLLDEPANFQDFWALRFFGQMFHEGINLAPPGKSKLAFRADISRPQWQRDLMDDVLDVNVCGSASRRYRPLVLERKERLGQVVIEYGGSNPVEASNVQPVAWSVDAWTLGIDGVLPWQTIGEDHSWAKADELALFYPVPTGGPPVPSVRLKAYRRGEQDVEYLTLYSQMTGEPRWALAEQVRKELKLSGQRSGTGFTGGEDAGRIDYGKLAPEDFSSLRNRIGAALSAGKPEAKDRLIDLRTPKRDPEPMAEKYLGK